MGIDRLLAVTGSKGVARGRATLLAVLQSGPQNQYSETKMCTLTTFRWETTPPNT